MKRFLLCATLMLLTLWSAFAAKTVYYIAPMDDLNFDQKEVNDWYARYLKRQYNEAEKRNADLVVITIDTPGGSVASMLEIKNLIVEASIDTAAFVNTSAFSAGAFIALSAKHVFMANGATMGAATPVVPSFEDGGMRKASEKEVSAMRAEIRAIAELRGRNPDIAEAMVDESVVLTRAKHGVDSPAGKLLTLTADEAAKTKMADGKANSITDILVALDMEGATVITHTLELSDYLLRLLSNPLVLILLIVIGIVGAFVEFHTAGFGVGGVVSIVSFALYFIIQIISGGGTWIAPLIFTVGIILLITEIFVIPGFGVVGIVGGMASFAGILLAFGVHRIEEAALVLFIALLLAVIIVVILWRFLPQSNAFRKITLEANLNGYAPSDDYSALKGKRGVALTDLRPAGVVEIGGIRYDAVSEGEFIEKGAKVCVRKVEGNRIVVS